MFSVLLLAGSFSQDSFGFGDYDLISEFGSFGISKSGHFSHPQFIAVGDDGSIYVGDFGNKRIQKFSDSGKYIAEWGKSGKQAGEFRHPTGIAVSADSVFVADRELHRIQKFSTDGEFIAEWGQKGIYDGQFRFPNGVAVNNGTLYVVDTGNYRVQMFSTDGEFISSFGSSGLGEGQLLTGIGIDIDSEGNVYVADRGNGKIEKFTADGEFIESLKFTAHDYVFFPEAIAIDPNDVIFIANAGNSRILHLGPGSDLSLNYIEQHGPYPDSFDLLGGLAIGSNGQLLAVDSLKHKINSFETPFYIEPEIVDSVEIPVVEVVVKEQKKPEITAPPSLIIEAEDLLTSVSYGEATATDGDGIKKIINNAPEAFSLGITNIIWIAFDNVGYSSSVYQTVNIQTCGKAYYDYNFIEGTPGDDVIDGTDDDDLIFGLEGDDLISGGLGNDCIFGGSGDDTLSGGDGDDTIKGNSGNDILKGELGDDVIYAGSGFNELDGNHGYDRCYPSELNRDLLSDCVE